MIVIGFLIGSFGIGLVERFAQDKSSAVTDEKVGFADVEFNLADNGRRVDSIDLTLAKTSAGLAIKYQLRPDGLWSHECLLEQSGAVSGVTRCEAPAGSSSEGTTALSVVLTR